MHPDRAREAIHLIDLTNLNDDCTTDDVAALCDRARRHETAAVCVWPDFVAQAARALVDVDVEVATVVNFPTGDERPFSVEGQTARAIADGATEIDVVLPYRAFVAGDHERAGAMLEAVAAVTAEHAHLKVILETGEMPDVDTVAAAARFAIGHGADFIKTSTGKSVRSATIEAVDVMLGEIAHADRSVGIKPSGGISTADAAEAYLDRAAALMGDSWVSRATFRFGASGLLQALIDVSRQC